MVTGDKSQVQTVALLNYRSPTTRPDAPLNHWDLVLSRTLEGTPIKNFILVSAVSQLAARVLQNLIF